MKMYVRILLFLLVSVQARAWAQAPSDPVLAMVAMQEKLGAATDYFGTLKGEKSLGFSFAGNFWVKGERFRIQLSDRELIGDGTYFWEIQHRDKKIKQRHYDPYVAPAIVHALRMVRLDLESEQVAMVAKGNDIYVDIESGSSVAQGSHILSIDPKTHDIIGFVLNNNQDDFLERIEIGQLRSDMTFMLETYSVNPDDWAKKGYTLLNMAQGQNLTVIPEEKALRPLNQ